MTDPGGVTSSAEGVVVSGNHRPTPEILSPAPESLYGDDDVIHFSGEAIDAEDGVLGCESFTWRVTLHHLGHVHPALGPVQGVCEGTFTTPPHGEGDTHYEIELTVEDSGRDLGEEGRLTGSRSIRIRPR